MINALKISGDDAAEGVKDFDDLEWGWSNLLDTDPTPSGFIVNDTLVFHTRVRVLKVCGTFPTQPLPIKYSYVAEGQSALEPLKDARLSQNSLGWCRLIGCV